MSNSPISVCFYCADQNTHRDRSRGITVYTHGLLSHLLQNSEVEVSALVSKSSFPVPNGLRTFTLPFRSDGTISRIATDHLHPLFSRHIRPDIWHYPKGFLPIGMQVRGKKIGTIADVMLQHDADHHPESRSRWAWVYWLSVLKSSIPNFDRVITISDFSKRQIQQFCDRHRLKCPPIDVIHPGVSVSQPSFDGRSKEGYVMHLASRMPYKGTRWLIEQWHFLSQRGTDLPPLRLIGDLDLPSMALLTRLPRVSLTPPLGRNELESVISRAMALLLPSEIEGFGIPAVEGYLLGTPVVYAKETALEETIGFGWPGGFERTADAFEIALKQALEMDRAVIANKADELGQRYSWDDCVRKTLEAYNAALML